MKHISITGIAFLNLYLGVAVICIAQENRNLEFKSSQAEETVVRLECSSGKSNQPRPEVKLQLGDVTKKALEIPQPKYPRMARSVRIAGKVRTEVVIDVHSGKVVWARLLNGHPLLRESILNAACRARFAPTFIDSPPIRVSGFITYKFGKL